MKAIQTMHTQNFSWRLIVTALFITSILYGCGSGSGSNNKGDTANTPPVVVGSAGTTALDPNLAPPPPAAGTEPSAKDGSRFLTQASFGVQSEQQITDLQKLGYERWLWDQFRAASASHVSYLDAQKSREMDGRAREEMSYEAVWKQWLNGNDQLRARVSWALLQIVVISNIAPDIRPYAMSSYMDMLGKNAFGNYRQLLEDVALHPAMGYYLNMIESEKEDPSINRKPNENFAREILQLFSIGLYKLNQDGSYALDAQGNLQPTYGSAEIQGFAKAFTGWSYGSLNNKDDNAFHNHDDSQDVNWITPMKAWVNFHSQGDKQLLAGIVQKGGQSPEADLKAALDNIFNHPNVPPFISHRLIQRLVTSNPSPAYVRRVADVFANNGQGVRGDLKAVVRDILLDPEARDPAKAAEPGFGKQREPVVRMANFLRATNATSKTGNNRIQYLDSAEDGLGQSPLLAPSVFNFYSPFYSPEGALANNKLAAPEFQLTTEISVAGSLNFFGRLINDEGYRRGGDDDVTMNLSSLEALANNTDSLIAQIDKLFFNYNMSDSTRTIIKKAIDTIDVNDKNYRVKAALKLTAVAPDYVIQK
jgi:uncharacterized protein (DUF1800 family)